LTFKNVMISAEIPKGRGQLPDTKVIINDVSGTILPGQFVAILGASGAGKTTLLNYLSGRQIGKKLRKMGQILVNGAERDNLP
jgi:ABC-type multidrug transport system ATPase subunit